MNNLIIPLRALVSIANSITPLGIAALSLSLALLVVLLFLSKWSK